MSVLFDYSKRLKVYKILKSFYFLTNAKLNTKNKLKLQLGLKQALLIFLSFKMLLTDVF